MMKYILMRLAYLVHVQRAGGRGGDDVEQLCRHAQYAHSSLTSLPPCQPASVTSHPTGECRISGLRSDVSGSPPSRKMSSSPIKRYRVLPRNIRLDLYLHTRTCGRPQQGQRFDELWWRGTAVAATKPKTDDMRIIAVL